MKEREKKHTHSNRNSYERSFGVELAFLAISQLSYKPKVTRISHSASFFVFFF